MAMSQNSVPLVNIPIPTKIGSKMGGEFTYPKMGSQNGFDNHSHISLCLRPTPFVQRLPGDVCLGAAPRRVSGNFAAGHQRTSVPHTPPAVSHVQNPETCGPNGQPAECAGCVVFMFCQLLRWQCYRQRDAFTCHVSQWCLLLLRT